jgi:hypothetical protein
VAFLYQHEETTVMDIMRAAVVDYGKTVLANIHEAFITEQKLGVELMMREKTHNEYSREQKSYDTPNSKI